MNNTNFINPTNYTYTTEFWNALRNRREFRSDIPNTKARHSNSSYILPAEQAGMYMDELKKENFFRRIATVIPMYMNDREVNTISSDAEAKWIPENGEIPEEEGIFGKYTFTSYKLATTVKLHTDHLFDEGFDFETWLIKKFSHRFARAEVKAFLTGTGENEPTGILADEGGGEIGVTTANNTSITFDEVMTLFHSLDPKFREKAVWVMNDETALHLRTLKDRDGNYLWSPSAEKLLGREVIISNAMPGIRSGEKPVAFGDFGYYWIMERTPFAVHSLREKYILQQMSAYMGFEYLDAKLIRPEAIKVMKMATT